MIVLCIIPVRWCPWLSRLLFVIIPLDQMLRHTRWNVDARPYYPPYELDDEQ